MPTTCTVVNCYNRHYKDAKISFYRFPKDKDHRQRWLAFVQYEDDSPWQPGDGDRICSDHFISKRKSDIPTNPDYVPSIRASIQSPCSNESPERLQERGQLNRFERAQRRSRIVTDQQRLQELQIQSDSISLIKAQKAFQLDHGSYCKQLSSHGAVPEVRMPPEQRCSMMKRLKGQPFRLK